MKIVFFVFLFLLSILSAQSRIATPTDSLLKILDRTIKEKPLYTQKKEQRIDSLKLTLKGTDDLNKRHDIYQKLYKEYRHYRMDSALWIVEEKLKIATDLHNEQYIYTARMNNAEILGIMGMYKESLDIIYQIDRLKLDKEQWSYYYHLYHSLYTLMSENSQTKKEKLHYEQLISQYKDSLLQVNNPNQLGYSLIKNGKLVEQGKYDEALSLMTQRYKEYRHDATTLGTLAYGLSDIYSKKGDTEREKEYLILSAIADLKRAVKGYIALRKLAILLYKEGDLDRAYAYIKFSMEDAAFCKARFRTLEISEALPIITAAYDMKVKQEKDNLEKYLILISILSFILIVSILFIWKQLKKLSSAKKAIKKMYEDLKQMNGDMQKMNEDLNELNKKLSESNLVKEEYIGSIFNLCSTYINKMESYRINVNRKLKSRQVEDALKLTSSTSLVTDELKEFFRNFDAIFLNIYPNFVEEFNTLLINGEQIIPKTGDILTPELRVFALVRLGITDSSKIASFLHYSPQTVYNYKLKVRNKLAISKEDFSLAIQQIGK